MHWLLLVASAYESTLLFYFTLTSIQIQMHKHALQGSYLECFRRGGLKRQQWLGFALRKPLPVVAVMLAALVECHHVLLVVPWHIVKSDLKLQNASTLLPAVLENPRTPAQPHS